MKNKVLIGACALFGVAMIAFGINKLVPFIPMPELSAEQVAVFGAFGTIKWLMPLVGIAEIVGGLLIAIPKTRALGALIIFPVVVGIFVHNAVFEPEGLGLAGFFLSVNLWAIVDSKEKYTPMIG